MENAGYTTVTRQVGLLREMQTVANNLANMSTTGFRQEGLVFAEHVRRLDDEGASLSMATANVQTTSSIQGTLNQTGGVFDFAIEGEGFFMVDTPAGERLTRAGSFTPNAEGELSSPEGFRLLDNGGAPIFVAPDAGAISVASDGTISSNGQPVAQIGVYRPEDPSLMRREDGVRFITDGPAEPMDNPVVLQGFLENANVNPVSEIARMIEVQHAYELGQSFLDKEDERIRAVLQTLGR